MINLEKAFDGRWNYKCGDFDDCEVRQLSGKEIKELCRDFFEAGMLLGESGESDMRPPHNKKLRYNIFASPSFEQWWIIYDKKRGKEKCWKKWQTLSPEEMGACLDATPAYVASTPDKAYRKDPLTYLNGKCWNDEIIFKDNGNKPTKQDPREKLASILIG